MASLSLAGSLTLLILTWVGCAVAPTNVRADLKLQGRYGNEDVKKRQSFSEADAHYFVGYSQGTVSQGEAQAEAFRNALSQMVTGMPQLMSKSEQSQLTESGKSLVSKVEIASRTVITGGIPVESSYYEDFRQMDGQRYLRYYVRIKLSKRQYSLIAEKTEQLLAEDPGNLSPNEVSLARARREMRKWIPASLQYMIVDNPMPEDDSVVEPNSAEEWRRIASYVQRQIVDAFGRPGGFRIQAAAKSGKLGDAFHLTSYFSLGPGGEIRLSLRAMDPRRAASLVVVKAELEPLRARLRIESTPAGALVTLGKRSGTSPCDFDDLELGTVAKLVISMNGYQTVEDGVRLSRRDNKRTYQLESRQVVVTLQVKPENASLFFDGVSINLSQGEAKLRTAPGPHVIEVSAPGHISKILGVNYMASQSYESEISLAEGEDLQLGPVQPISRDAPVEKSALIEDSSAIDPGMPLEDPNMAEPNLPDENSNPHSSAYNPGQASPFDETNSSFEGQVVPQSSPK